MQSGRAQLLTYLERAHLTQRDLARRLGISEPALSQYMTGNRRPPLETALKIEQETGIPMRAWAQRRERTRQTDGREQEAKR